MTTNTNRLRRIGTAVEFELGRDSGLLIKAAADEIVQTDDELINAQQQHIEKLQAKLPRPDAMPGRVREG